MFQIVQQWFHDFEYLSQQDINKLKEELRAKEAIKEAEAKRRGISFFFYPFSYLFFKKNCDSEKIEDAKARAAIKAQIEADKKARAEKAAREKAIRDGQVIETTPVPAPTTPAAAASTSSSEAKETRLQIRLSTGGPPLTTTLSSDARESLFFCLTRTIVIIDGDFYQSPS